MRGKRVVLTGDVPSPIDPPSGRRFHTRCPFRFNRRRSEAPLRTARSETQAAVCHLETLPALG